MALIASRSANYFKVDIMIGLAAKMGGNVANLEVIGPMGRYREILNGKIWGDSLDGIHEHFLIIFDSGRVHRIRGRQTFLCLNRSK